MPGMMQTEAYSNFITTLEKQKICRVLPDYLLSKNEGKFLDFSSNDYLNFSQSASIINASIKSVQQYGLGSTGSRLLSGNLALFEEFESLIATTKKTEKALIFNSGFQANLTVLSALLDKKNLKSTPLVFFDKLNHKSLYEAVKLSGAKLVRYAHNDMNHLAFLLQKYQNHSEPKFIVTETLYGMDGDIIDHRTLVDLARQYGALLYLDEAHATGILGQEGYGLSTEIDFQGVEHVVMGTFSKALGGSGAYIACSAILHQYLINHCAGFIYSTACSPMIIGAMKQAWTMLPEFQPKVLAMLKLADYLRKELKKKGLDTGQSTTHIIPIIYQDPIQTLALKNKLFEKKLITSFIQYPTVPKNQPRLRIALNIAHQKKDIDNLVSYL